MTLKKEILHGALLPVCLLILWIGGDWLLIWPPYIIPTPYDVAAALKTLWVTGMLKNHIAISFYRVFAGFSLAFLGAFFLAVGLALQPRYRTYVTFSLELIRHIPPLAALPMLILWFGIGELPKLMIVILATFFPIFLNTLQGFLACDAKLLEVGKSFNLSSWERFYRIMLPAALPAVLAGMQLGLGYSWRALIGAELIAASSGIGYMILDAEQLARPDVVVVGILTIGIVGSVIDWLFFYGTKLVIPWAKGGDMNRGWS